MLFCSYHVDLDRTKMTSKRKNRVWAPTGFEEWGGYMAAKKAKLEEQFHEQAEGEFKTNSLLFQRLCIFVNGYTKPSAEQIRLLMMEHGGVYHHYMRPGITTHIIASNLPYSKIMMHKKSQNPLPICKPEWITDSLSAGKLLNYQDYLLYSQHTRTQPKLAFATAPTKLANKTVDNRTENESIQTSNVSPVPGTSKDEDIQVTIQNSGNTSPETTHHRVNRASSLDESVQSTSNQLNASIGVPGTSNVSESGVHLEQVAVAKKGQNGPSNSTKNPEFLSEFYNNSRLHHIATMGATFKDYIGELRDKNDKSFPGLEKLKQLTKLKKAAAAPEQFDSEDEEILDSSIELRSKKQESVLMHIDMDCFFVSVGIRNRPELKGLPVAVTHAKGNRPTPNAGSWETEIKGYEDRVKQKLKKINKSEHGDGDAKVYSRFDKFDENSSLSEIASCSYEARKAGIKNGMFLGQALKLCPNLKMISYDFEAYKEVSYALYDTVATYTLDIEAVSCDEMYADCTKIIAESGLQPLEFAEIIRKEISEKTGCPVSTGFGKNKLLARLATKKAKPNGHFHIKSEDIQSYISNINIRELPGVGTTMSYKLKGMGVHTCVELQSVSLGELQREMGKKTGEMLYNMCRGKDNSKLCLEHVRKSVSAEVNYGIRFQSTADAEKFFEQLSEEVCTRLNKAKVKGRCVTLKLMIRSKNAPLETAKFMGHGLCDHFTRSKNLISPVNSVSIINKEVLSLWQQLQQAPEDVRGVGIQISRLESTKKSGNSCLMSFIGKARPTKPSEQPKILENENVTNEAKPRGLNGFLISKPRSAVAGKSSITVNSNTEIRSFCSEVTKKNVFLINGVRPEIKKTLVDAVNDDNQPSRLDQPFDQRTAPSTSEGKRRDLEDHAILQDIDEAVLAELPEDIRNEIISAAKNTDHTKVTSKSQKPQLIQKTQDSYFKESKRNIERPKKTEMPPLQEIDLAILLELPDDIRNEILNEYRDRANESKQPQILEPRINEGNNKSSNDEANLTISQVDPDFLAALPQDIQNDVKDYCASKKLEKKAKSEQLLNRNVLIPKQQKASTSKLTLNQKTVRKTKSKLTNVKNTSKSKRTVVTPSAKILPQVFPEVVEQITDNAIPADLRENNTAEIKIGNNIQENVDNIKSLSMAAKSGDPEDQNAMLQRLVEEFMSLPLREVKVQLKNWILESESVNEVDFLAFTTFLSSLPQKKRIEDLHVLLKTMHRCVETTRRCLWHRAYRKTVERVQRHMLATYDSSLMVPSLECERLDCRNYENF